MAGTKYLAVHSVAMVVAAAHGAAGDGLYNFVQTNAAARPTSWIRRQIVFEKEPLAKVAAEFNRYAPIPMEIVTPSLRSLPVSGVFAIDDTESLIAFLRSLKGVRIDVTPTQIRVSRR